MSSQGSCLVKMPSEAGFEFDSKINGNMSGTGLNYDQLSESQIEAMKAEMTKKFDERPTFVMVDPWSTGNRLCSEIVSRGCRLIIVWENNKVRSQSILAEEVLMCTDFQATVQRLKELKEEFNIKCILPGSETGVILAEKLGNALGYPTNPPKLAEARRNKYLMAEALREKGVRAVKQTITKDINEAKEFVLKMNPQPFRVILKPNMGAGSDDVFLCKSMEEVEAKFAIINGKCNSLGLQNDGVLVQEYLNGTEYVIDTVSRKGNHRMASIWVYDKREVNDRFNVYFGSFPMVNNSETTQQLMDYVFQVLNALEIKNGPAHAEIKMTDTGPCLVEIGSRCHGGGGTWLEMAQRVWGFNQLSMVVDRFITDDGEESELGIPPSFPTEFKEFGVVLDFVQYEDGELAEIIGDEIVRSLPSFFAVAYCNKVGDKLVKTVDCNTTPGQLILIHQDEDQVRRDYQYVHDMLKEKDIFFKLRRL